MHKGVWFLLGVGAGYWLLPKVMGAVKTKGG